jgi:signal transduction histidine kinase
MANAVKFTRQGQVVLRISCQQRKGAEYLQFQVEDTGIGIPADKLSLIFDSFTQADNSNTREFGGTGLGLAITKRLIELLGGSIHVTSTPGVGSVFSLWLPVHPVS